MPRPRVWIWNEDSETLHFLFLDSDDELDDRPSFGQTTNQSVAMKTKGTVKRTFDKIKDAREKGDEDDDDNLSADKYIKIMPQQGVQNPLAMKMMVDDFNLFYSF